MRGCLFIGVSLTLHLRNSMNPKPFLTILPMLVLTGCAAIQTEGEAAISQASYELGLLHIKTLREGRYKLDQPAYEAGLQDALKGDAAAQAAWPALANNSLATLKTANLAAGKAFLEQNKIRKEVVSLPSGVQYEVLKPGKGSYKPSLEDTVGILYKITGIDGTLKVNTLSKGDRKMYEILLQKLLSKGWQEALRLMTEGSQWRIYIPGELAFGEKGLSEKNILPNETLVIETHLDSIVLPPK